MPIGVKVTFRKKSMYNFLDKLINLALPKCRDFQGVPTALMAEEIIIWALKRLQFFLKLNTILIR